MAMAIEKPHAGEGGEHETTTGLPNTKLAMWLFLASECLLFGALISTYVLYRGASTSARTRPTCSTSRTRPCPRSCCWPRR